MIPLTAHIGELGRALALCADSVAAAEHARDWLKREIQNDHFVRSCCGFMIDSFAMNGAKWRLGDIETPGGRIKARILVWPPHYENPPHEHRCWTVAGVLLNRVTISVVQVTGDRDPLEVESRFIGEEQSVGLLRPPCIHRIANLAAQPAASIHIFEVGGPDEEPRRGSNTVWLGNGVDRYRLGLRARAELAVVELLRKRPSASSAELLERLFPIAGRRTRLAICQTEIGMAPGSAIRHLELLAQEVGGEPGSRLRRIAAGVEEQLGGTIR